MSALHTKKTGFLRKRNSPLLEIRLKHLGSFMYSVEDFASFLSALSCTRAVLTWSLNYQEMRTWKGYSMRWFYHLKRFQADHFSSSESKGQGLTETKWLDL